MQNGVCCALLKKKTKKHNTMFCRRTFKEKGRSVYTRRIFSKYKIFNKTSAEQV